MTTQLGRSITPEEMIARGMFSHCLLLLRTALIRAC